MKNQEFKFGKDIIPDWLNEQANLGRVKFNYNDEMTDIKSITVFTPTKTITANKGDILVLGNFGVSVRREENRNAYKVGKGR